MKNFPCGLCGEIEYRKLVQRKDKYKQEITLVLCTKCGLQRLNPRFDKKEEEAFYSSDYYQLYGMGKKKAETPHWIARKNSIAKEILDAVETHHPLSGARLLDIGCGYGFLLRDAKERGAIASGVELSKEAGETLQAEGYSVFIGKLTEFLS